MQTKTFSKNKRESVVEFTGNVNDIQLFILGAGRSPQDFFIFNFVINILFQRCIIYQQQVSEVFNQGKFTEDVSVSMMKNFDGEVLQTDIADEFYIFSLLIPLSWKSMVLELFFG